MSKNDQFAEIAAGGTRLWGKDLEVPRPEEITVKALPFWNECHPVYLPEGMHTAGELYQELERKKEQYRTFLSNMAPSLEGTRRRLELREFDWRVETEADQKDRRGVLDGKGSWERVTIPHFGPPLGRAAAYYRLEAQLEEMQPEEALFLHFNGVDYKAEVYVNDALAGTHEGFFAPFEYDITPWVKPGINVIMIRVENDFAQKRSQAEEGGRMYGGDKLYAATGPGYDEPGMGWHHCPPGMGIWQEVYLEMRKRCFLQDIYVRPLPKEKRAQVWLQVYSCDVGYEEVTVELSVYGRNFQAAVLEHFLYIPETEVQTGLGDTYTEAQMKLSGGMGRKIPLYMERGLNYLTIPVDMGDFRLWEPDTPYLYEVQAVLRRPDGTILDSSKQSFGMREFYMDTQCSPKGEFRLNGKKIRLRGANTMGHEQQCVMKGDMEQLLTDLLLAKICNMNFLRLTQRPVQDEVYQYCDMVGLMTQTDLPLFGVLRRNMTAEALRQAQEMEQLVRKHPCNILISYINEPFPNSYNQPHRHLKRYELMEFFACADKLVRMNYPEQVVKHVDGDYDPPNDSLPDNHCYTCWYNGHGVSLGELHKGYWLPVKKGWNYGCGEYGAEGLDTEEVMRRFYPREWLPGNEEEEKSWSPERIAASQTANFHYFFYPTQETLEGWVQESRKHQAWAAKWMTEAFRRDRRMVSSAIHLFIDAFPAGWMKAIMDVERNPKPAYFAYRNALTPLMVSLRTDRFAFYQGETISVEVWECNDRPEAVPDAILYYEVKRLGQERSQTAYRHGTADLPAVCSAASIEEILHQGEYRVAIEESTSRYQGSIVFEAGKEGVYTIRTMLSGPDGEVLHTNREQVKVWTRRMEEEARVWTANRAGRAGGLLEEMGITPSGYWGCADRKDSAELPDTAWPLSAGVLLFDSYASYEALREETDHAVREGARAVFLELEEGEYRLGDSVVKVRESGMLPMNFAAVHPEHPLAAGFGQEDFRNWYDPGQDRIEPFLDKTFTSGQFQPALTSGNTDDEGVWGKAMAVGTCSFGKGLIILCQLKLNGRIRTNPAAAELAFRMLGSVKGV